MTKRLVFNCILLFLSIALTITVLELLLKWTGFQPWKYYKIDLNEPSVYEPDPVLGWKNKPGTYIVPPYDPLSRPIQITFLEDGRRRTGFHPSGHSKGELILVGGSFTQGWAINDEETYAWKLQEKLPFLHVLNYGTGGYGTYQSLLTLERELPRWADPQFVLYGFIGHHEFRNVAPGSWLEVLSRFSRRGHVYVPFSTFDPTNGFVRHPPERYLELPLRESSALVALIEKAYMTLKTMRRLSQKRSTTEQILLQMRRASEQHHATFIVVLLHADRQSKKHYTKFLAEKNIKFIDCAYNITAGMRVPGEVHPNGKMNTLWAQCISNKLEAQFKKIRPSTKR